MVRLWWACADADGATRHLPWPGAMLDQGEWLMGAFALCAGARARIVDEMRKREKEGQP